jgi:hypothetical protein
VGPVRRQARLAADLQRRKAWMATLTDDEIMGEVLCRKLDYVRKVDVDKIRIAEGRAHNTGHLEGYLMGEVAGRARAQREAERNAEQALLRRMAWNSTQDGRGFPKAIHKENTHKRFISIYWILAMSSVMLLLCLMSY